MEKIEELDKKIGKLISDNIYRHIKETGKPSYRLYGDACIKIDDDIKKVYESYFKDNEEYREIFEKYGFGLALYKYTDDHKIKVCGDERFKCIKFYDGTIVEGLSEWSEDKIQSLYYKDIEESMAKVFTRNVLLDDEELIHDLPSVELVEEALKYIYKEDEDIEDIISEYRSLYCYLEKVMELLPKFKCYYRLKRF